MQDMMFEYVSLVVLQQDSFVCTMELTTYNNDKENVKPRMSQNIMTVN